MFEVILVIICILTLIILKFALGINFKKLKKFKTRGTKKLENLATKFPSNIEICNKILEIKNKKDVNIKEEEDYDSCLYTVFNNTITIGKFKQEYMKLQTIAHECIHSMQNKFTLWFNFIFTIIYLIYFITISILTIFDRIENTNILLMILIFMSIIQYIVRFSLESDAMQNAKYLAKEYIENTKILTIEEEKMLLEEYDSVNRIGIPFTNFELITKNIMKILIYLLIIIF